MDGDIDRAGRVVAARWSPGWVHKSRGTYAWIGAVDVQSSVHDTLVLQVAPELNQSEMQN